MKRTIYIAYILLFFILSSCNNDDEAYTPKPRGYYRISLPEHSYKTFDPKDCPFSFEIPTYAFPILDTNSLSEPCWYYLILPKFNGQVYLTYKSLKGDLYDYTENTRTLVYKHTSRASSINEKVVSFNKNVNGIYYEIGGDAASPIQFFVTDSSKHFLRGSLYFNAPPNADSLSPVIQYINQDLLRLLETLKWK